MSARHPGSIYLRVDTLEDGLIETAHWVWERRGTAKAESFPFSRETVTDGVVLDLATALRGHIKIVPINTPLEGPGLRKAAGHGGP